MKIIEDNDPYSMSKGFLEYCLETYGIIIIIVHPFYLIFGVPVVAYRMIK